MTSQLDRSAGEHRAIPDTVFHYTNAHGLIGIVESCKVWASDHRFLNDEQESVYGRKELIERISGMENPVSNPGHWAHHLGEPAIETFDSYVNMALAEFQEARSPVYVTCFCESGDLLGQWRAYGREGYAIEFRTTCLSEALQNVTTYPPATGFGKVAYGIDQSDEIVNEAISKVASFNLNHPGIRSHYAAMSMESTLARIKHPSFVDEHEWRLVIGLERFSVDSPQLDERIKFRASSVGVVPYIEVPLSKDAIVSVNVSPGPRAYVRQAGIERLLSSYGIGVPITTSDVPLRW